MYTLEDLYEWQKKQTRNKIGYFNTHILFLKDDKIEIFQRMRNEYLASIDFNEIDKHIVNIGNYYQNKILSFEKVNSDLTLASNKFRELFSGARGYEIQMLLLNLKDECLNGDL